MALRNLRTDYQPNTNSDRLPGCWTAVEDTYGPELAQGHGTTEEEAIADLREQVEAIQEAEADQEADDEARARYELENTW